MCVSDKGLWMVVFSGAWLVAKGNGRNLYPVTGTCLCYHIWPEKAEKYRESSSDRPVMFWIMCNSYIFALYVTKTSLGPMVPVPSVVILVFSSQCKEQFIVFEVTFFCSVFPVISGCIFKAFRLMKLGVIMVQHRKTSYSWMFQMFKAKSYYFQHFFPSEIFMWKY